MSEPHAPRHSILAAVTAIISAYDDPRREGLQETPSRVARAYDELLGGYTMNPTAILSKTFDADGYAEMVLCRDIDFVSLCEHHMLPFIGTVTVGYIPQARVVGLSKIPRLVHAYASRLQLQERMTAQIADAMVTALCPAGVGVIVKSRHMCMSARGVKQAHATAVTQALRGVFLTDGVVRSEFIQAART